MADYRKIARHFPAVRDYLRNRRWVRRGDVTAYAPSLSTPSFTTDAFGFRQTVLAGRRYGLGDAAGLERYALVLGSSHIFGFGLAGDHQTMGSQLSERLGYPCLAVCFPEADTRSLHAALLRILSQVPRRPERVILFNGGDLTRFSYTGKADALFGSPDFERGAGDPDPADEAAAIARLIHFSTFWALQMRDAAAAAGAAFTLADEPTFFEKPNPDAIEIDCGLGGVAQSEPGRFALHRRSVWTFHKGRVALLRSLGADAWPACYDEYGFIDEFHYRAETIGRLAALIA